MRFRKGFISSMIWLSLLGAFFFILNINKVLTTQPKNSKCTSLHLASNCNNSSSSTKQLLPLLEQLDIYNTETLKHIWAKDWFFIINLIYPQTKTKNCLSSHENKIESDNKCWNIHSSHNHSDIVVSFSIECIRNRTSSISR